MIYKRYGTALHSVGANFDSKALNEIGFRRDRQKTMAGEDFASGFEHMTTHELATDAEGDVQDETEQLLLQRLEARLDELVGALRDGEILLVENGEGHDWPKTRQQTRNVVVEGENRLRFTYAMSPPLRLGVYRSKSST